MPHDLDAKPPFAALCRRLLTLALFAGLCLAAAAASAPTAAAQTPNPGSPDLVISQVYARGGEPGAAFSNDFVEIFNRGNTTINLSEYSVQVLVNAQPQPGFPGGLVVVVSRFVSSRGAFLLEPGRYLLLAFGSSGSNGAPLPGVFFPRDDFNMPSTFGRVALVRGMAPVAQFGCPVGTDAALVDFFSYGTAACAEGSVIFAVPSAANAAVRNGDGCADTDNNVADFAAAAANPRTDSTPARLCNQPAPASSIQFEAASASVNENAGSAEIFVTRTGDTSGPASVQYATSDDMPSATDRTDYTTTFGTLNFAAGETRKSFRVLVNDDVRAESGNESFLLGLAYPAGAALGARHIMRLGITDNDTGGAANPIDGTDFFVRQHYADFLHRLPDAEGLAFWSSQIEECGADAQCREVRRVNVSAAFFLSIEFQQTGYFAHRAYVAAFADNTIWRPRNFPTYRELVRDTQEIGRDVVVHQGDWEQRLAANRQGWLLEFVNRPEFLIRYPAEMTPVQFVHALNTHTGGALSQAEQDQLVAELTAANNSQAGRAAVLKRVVEDEDFVRSEFNRAFVLMQYFGYLRRNPHDPPDGNFVGYDFWLSKLFQFNGNYIQAEMVKAFLLSDEYRRRFAP